MTKTKRVALDAVFAAIALLLFMVEAQIPSVIPVPGIKLGLANIMTLVAMDTLGKRDAAAVLFVRITLGAVLAGNLSTFLFSSTGALFCFIVLCALSEISVPVFAKSVCGAMAHNVGQIVVAAFYMHTRSILWYLPFLFLAAVISGSFTGICAQYSIRFLKKRGDKIV